MSSLCRDHWITHVAYAKVGSVSWENETSTPGLTFYVLPSSYPTLVPCILISMTTKRPQKIMCALMMGYVANDGRARTGWEEKSLYCHLLGPVLSAEPSLVPNLCLWLLLSANFSLLTFVNVSISIWMEKYWRRRNKELSLQHSLLFKLILLHKQG